MDEFKEGDEVVVTELCGWMGTRGVLHTHLNPTESPFEWAMLLTEDVWDAGDVLYVNEKEIAHV